MEKEIWTIDDIIKDYEDQGLAGRSKADFLKDVKDFILKIKNTKYVLVPSMSSEEQEKVLKEVREKMKEKIQNGECRIVDYINPPIVDYIDTYTPKKYLKWEDLNFTDDKQKIKVKLNGEDYTVVYFKTQTFYSRSSKYVGVLKDDDFIVYSIITDRCVEYNKKFFNDLHLEVVE